MSCKKSDNIQASKEPLALDTAHLMLRKITEMDSHSAFSRKVGIKRKYRTSNLSCFQKWFKALKTVWFYTKLKKILSYKMSRLNSIPLEGWSKALKWQLQKA